MTPLKITSTMRVLMPVFLDLWKALELANIATFVSSLPDGLKTKIGNRGSSLSVGQARADCTSFGQTLR